MKTDSQTFLAVRLQDKPTVTIDTSEYPYDKCPRCNGEWKVEYKEISDYGLQCSSCGSRLLKKRGDFVFRIHFTTCMLLWNLNDHSIYAANKEIKVKECQYFKGNCIEEIVKNDYDDMNMILPWLPFDITEERLKLLLVFS